MKIYNHFGEKVLCHRRNDPAFCPLLITQVSGTGYKECEAGEMFLFYINPVRRDTKII